MYLCRIQWRPTTIHKRSYALLYLLYTLANKQGHIKLTDVSTEFGVTFFKAERPARSGGPLMTEAWLPNVACAKTNGQITN